MKLLRFSVSAFALLTVSFPLMSVAHADTYTATVYLNTPDAANAADPLNQGSNLASANFTIGSLGINFVAGSSPTTSISAFLNNPTFSNQVNGFNPNTQTNNSEVVISGTLYLNAGNNSFVVGHDDGVVLNIAGFGNVVNAPGASSFSNSPFNVNATTAGYYNFNLQYSECCAGPADLLFTVNNAPPIVTSTTPEPGTLILLGTGVLSAAGTIRRRILS